MASSQSAEVHITYSSHVNSTYRSVQRRKVAWAAHISLPPNIMSQVSKACCSIPPVKTDYQPKGSMEKVAGFDSYVVGPADSKNVLVCVYDIFGFWDTTKQCADLLSDSMKVKVVMPDFLRNKPWPIASFPPSNEEENKKFQEWFSTVASVPDAKKDVEVVAQELKKNGADKLGLYGFCWGGKITSLAGYEGTLYSGVAIVHPAMVNGEDSKGLTVPVAFFPSKDEPRDESDKYWENFQKSHPELVEKSMYHYYDNMFHGFGSARANLKDEANRVAAEDLYKRLANFFCGVF